MSMIYEHQLVEMYEEMLDECYPLVKLAGGTYSASRTLKLVDNVAYRTGMADFADSLSKDGYEVEGYE